MDNSANSVAIFDKHAELYQQKYMDVSLYHEMLRFFCNSVKPNEAEILELACGPGNVTQFLLKIRPDFKIFGTDLAPNMVQLAKENNPKAEFKILDCREIESLKRNFDAVMCSFCLPYLNRSEVQTMIAAIYNVLRTGGVVYLSTMEDDYENSGEVSASTGDKMHMYYYTLEDLTSILVESDFEVAKTQRQPFPTNNGTVVTDLIIIARKVEKRG